MSELNPNSIPTHVAIIMDGNGRWAQSKDLPRIEGHRQGATVVEEITEEARELGVKHLTLYAFSQENWNRPTEETAALMQLLVEFLVSKKDKMLKNGIALNAIGDLKRLPAPVYDLLFKTIDETSAGQQMTLTLALSYGSKDEWVRSVKQIASDLLENKINLDDINEDQISSYLDTKNLPDPDLIIRTSGEKRISNFLLWQGAYAELNFVDQNWPEFSRQDFKDCLVDYQKRERRFGKTSEQLEGDV